MGHYLISLDLSGKLCLVIGGGQVAERKVCSLLECDASVQVVGPELTPGLRDMAESGRILYRQGQYRPADLDNVFLVICATDNKEVNQQVAGDCTDRNLFVNIVDDPKKCNFFVPAVVKRGALSIAVSTGGKSPLLARKIREELETAYGLQYGEFLDLIADIRQDVINNISDPKKKKEILENMVCDEVLCFLKSGRMDLVKERIASAYRSSRT
ncbi:bifunctional precorrin-2 dehydrogenase/sirohydrochlorin ferrochelatase [Pelotomaculum terephthalicicum JT]|uniref:precorrin-2 dehydrogenase/sirohydrochlorin ferrochelatase family protein n=1 Tax=Pelotomaculum TaxID=191373 RepID=UPI0009C6A3BD|nr:MULTISPECIES: bifunctional precorrin-2 dehydrogenase/sirohydrochlorin ferrochelatase [Pelotomaculum]MCG9967597.1 bifunctional precorrin-2 dehydrogenase/sirohydrochlorin ferrochelatase [Pelotomaculum terephthalicicum JT]OPX91670.1 MAG: Siroheme synthase [Pelotomaculum sp. PtaB.Bin117]OPY61828.1 MAG: Siroheme synthase [Pelotomaculum sp. PtaU1.Bin065]